MSDFNESGAKRLWRSQPSEIPAMSTVYLRHRAGELERASRRRNILELGTGLVTLIACAILLFTTPYDLARASVALLMVGIGWAMFQWRRRARERSDFASAGSSIAFYIRELEHKRDLHKTLWRWYLLPMMPGTVAFMTWSLVGDPNARGTPTPWIVTGLVLAWIIGAVCYERAKAAQYQREIDALAALNADASARPLG